MTESNESSQEASIKDASIAGQVGQAGERLVQVQGEGAMIVDGQGNTVHQYTITQIGGNEPQVRELMLASRHWCSLIRAWRSE